MWVSLLSYLVSQVCQVRTKLKKFVLLILLSLFCHKICRRETLPLSFAIMRNLNPYASDFIPLQVKATSTQKSVEFLCKRTALEALIIGLEEQADKCPASDKHISGKQEQATSALDENDIHDFALKQAQAMISGLWSQVQGLQSLSHAKLYLQDSDATHRVAKLSNFDSMNQSLVRIFGERVPVAMQHVKHEFYYEIVHDQLFYGVELCFTLEDGVNHVARASIYGFTDALMQVYEAFYRRVQSWGVQLAGGCQQPIYHPQMVLRKSYLLNMAGIKKQQYSKEQLLRIASETTANASLVNDITQKLIPWDLGREDSTKVVEIPLAMAPVWSMPLPSSASETYNPTDLCALLQSKSTTATMGPNHVTLCAS
eukprot:TRINITY_DN5239_c0_g1_i2.p1 TRINITY_DN5239_c0_g1~~TRINITY_DN5239_c0_g1_i2.p1  ORF type:complete len:370 (-),score=14.89 TRINITY_DN5239_c0_g1_i2:476-1585(-)